MNAKHQAIYDSIMATYEKIDAEIDRLEAERKQQYNKARAYQRRAEEQEQKECPHTVINKESRWHECCGCSGHYNYFYHCKTCGQWWDVAGGDNLPKHLKHNVEGGLWKS